MGPPPGAAPGGEARSSAELRGRGATAPPGPRPALSAPSARDDGVEVEIEAPPAMPTNGDAAELAGRQFRRPRKRIHSTNDLSRWANLCSIR